MLPARWLKRCGFQQQKEVPMKDHLMKTINYGKHLRIHFYRSSEFQIVFVGQRCRMHFHFNKNEYLIYSFQTTPYGKSINNKDKANNWKLFKQYAIKDESNLLPARFKRLAKWRFDNIPQYRIVEDQIGCIVYFRREEIK